MIDPQPMETWDLWYPSAAATGASLRAGRLDPTDVLWVHSGEEAGRHRPSLRWQRARRGQVTRDGDYLPMTRLSLADGGLAREDRWPTADDLGSLVILPGGEVGTLVEWWNAPTARSGAGDWSSTTAADHPNRVARRLHSGRAT